MFNLHERNCANCGGVFSLVYTDSRGYKSILDTTYCSRSCASTSSLKINKGCITADVGRDALKQEALTFIQQKGEYCTKEEICSGTNHSSKTFAKHGLKISELNEELSFNKPKSKFQEDVGKILKENFANIEKEKRFEGLVGNTGHPLRVDFYIPEANLVVEADGSQHHDAKHPWGKWNNGTVKEYDGIKDKFFEEKGIRLVRVAYKRKITSSDILNKVS